MKNLDLDPDLERLFRAEDAPLPSRQLLARIDALIDRRSRHMRVLAVLGGVAAMTALVVTVPWVVTFADDLVATIDPGTRDFETAVTSGPAVAGALLALALAAPWLWLRTVGPRRARR